MTYTSNISDFSFTIPSELIIALIIFIFAAYKIFQFMKKKSNKHKGKKEIENSYKELKEGMFANVVEEILGPDWVQVSSRILENGDNETVFRWFLEYAEDNNKYYSAKIEGMFINNCLYDKSINFIKGR